MTDAGTNLSSEQLRRMVVGALSNPRLRRVLAEIIDADDPPITADERRAGRRLLRQFGMRRALVDAGLLVRNPDGTQYRRSERVE